MGIALARKATAAPPPAAPCPGLDDLVAAALAQMVEAVMLGSTRLECAPSNAEVAAALRARAGDGAAAAWAAMLDEMGF